MDLKKRNYFAQKKEDSTFSKQRKRKTINKKLFPHNFVCFPGVFFCFFFQTSKDSVLVDFYNAAVRHFLKFLEHLQRKVCE